jgi:hypothetical protein
MTEQAQPLQTPSALKKLIGGAGDRDDGTACLVTAAAWIAGEDASVGDAPPGVCPVIRRIGIRTNDAGWWDSDEERTEVLLPLAAKIVGTRGSARLAARRSHLVAQRILTVIAPQRLERIAALIEARQPEEAAKLRERAAKMRETKVEQIGEFKIDPNATPLQIAIQARNAARLARDRAFEARQRAWGARWSAADAAAAAAAAAADADAAAADAAAADAAAADAAAAAAAADAAAAAAAAAADAADDAADAAAWRKRWNDVYQAERRETRAAMVQLLHDLCDVTEEAA